MTPKDLPELPKPEGVFWTDHGYGREPIPRATFQYPADQMHAYGRACYELGARSTAAQPVEPLTPDVVEQRLLTWRQRLMNKSGDRLALDDFMGQESIDDLIDFVCAPPAASGDSTPPSAPVQGDPSGALRQEAEAAGQGRWQLIETAPKDGTEVLAYREDCGPFIARWTNAAELMTTEEMEREQLDDETLFAEDWFYADFIQGGRADGSEAPTHWMPLPEPPQAASGSRGD